MASELYVKQDSYTVRSPKEHCINIVCCFNEDYLPLAATMLMSLLRNHISYEILNIYLINEGISSQAKMRLTSLFPFDKMTIHWLDLKPTYLPIILGLSRDYNNISYHYYRLAMPYLLPKSISRVIYLDVDLIVLEDIAKLWRINLGSQIIGAAQDFLENCERGIPNCLDLGINPKSSYFNSGVLLINLQKWRDQDISRRAMICRLAHEETIRASQHYCYDQFGLNVVLAHQWYTLDKRWNYSPGPEKAVVDPAIVHYYGDTKPWSSKCRKDFRQHFLHYLNQTGYQDDLKGRFTDLNQGNSSEMTSEVSRFGRFECHPERNAV